MPSDESLISRVMKGNIRQWLIIINPIFGFDRITLFKMLLIF